MFFCVRIYDVLKFLDKIVKVNFDKRWYEFWLVKFGKIFKWVLVVGFGYVYKVYNEKCCWIFYFLFIGEFLIGKIQVIFKVILYFWKLFGKVIFIGFFWSVYDFGEIIFLVVFVIVINEVVFLFKFLNFGDEGDNFFNFIKNVFE